ALNKDLPYDRFLTLQLAGDEVDPDDPSAFLATGFNRNWPFEDNNKVPGLSRQLMLEDMTDTTSSDVLAMTLGYAPLHNHKYDPISQADYYRLQGLSAASTPRDDRPLTSPAEVAKYKAAETAHKAQVAAIRKRLAAVERPYLAALLKDRLDKLPPEVRAAL